MSREDQNFHFEEAFHAQEKRDSRKERKIASSKDRSKYKKSNQDQLKKNAPEFSSQGEQLNRGRVLAITPEGILVDFEKKRFICSLKGALKQEKLRIKNLVAVGDFVLFSPQHENEGIIFHIEERRSILSRADNLSRRKEQLIAVNIDQVLIVGSVLHPRLKPALIDRYIIAAKKGNMESLIVINKIDLLERPPEFSDPEAVEEEKNFYEAFRQAYSDLGIPIFPVSTATGEGLVELKAAMKGKTSVFSGQSGVGKSSLINALLGTELAIGEIVAKNAQRIAHHYNDPSDSSRRGGILHRYAGN